MLNTAAFAIKTPAARFQRWGVKKLHVDHMNWFYFTKIVENVGFTLQWKHEQFFCCKLITYCTVRRKNLLIGSLLVLLSNKVQFTVAMQLIRKRHHSARSQWNKDKNVDFSLCKRNRTLLMEKAKTVTVTRGYQRGVTAAALSVLA